MKFRPPNHRQAVPPTQYGGPSRPVPPPALDYPRPDTTGTITALLGLLLTALFLGGEKASDVGRAASFGALASVSLSLSFDLRAGGLKNLIRADVMAILAFYFLTLFEFLFPQPDFDMMLARDSAYSASLGVLLGFAGLLVGRHLVRVHRQPFAETMTREIPAAWIIAIYWTCVLVAYAHMLIAVNFDIAEMVHYFMEPRFAQPWGRGRLGDWKALFVELGMLLYLIPPLGGIIFARRNRYGAFTLVTVAVALLFTFFYAFSSGTRNVFASYLVTFLIGYAFAAPFIKRTALIAVAGTTAVVFVVASHFMLQFRSDGLNNYLDGGYVAPAEERSYFVDYNLWAIGKLMETFPKTRDYLGWEIPYQALVRPIPRALWKGKPEGLSFSIEEATGAEGMTVASSFVGEAYMSGGFLAIALAGLALGFSTGWWSSLASPRNSELGILIYASGFFAAVISMRSLFVLTTALLPTVAALVIGTYAARLLARKAQELLARLKQQRASNYGRPARPGPRPPAR
jgi:oligosaccharide repeat unit polymerase